MREPPVPPKLPPLRASLKAPFYGSFRDRSKKIKKILAPFKRGSRKILLQLSSYGLFKRWSCIRYFFG